MNAENFAAADAEDIDKDDSKTETAGSEFAADEGKVSLGGTVIPNNSLKNEVKLEGSIDNPKEEIKEQNNSTDKQEEVKASSPTSDLKPEAEPGSQLPQQSIEKCLDSLHKKHKTTTQSITSESNKQEKALDQSAAAQKKKVDIDFNLQKKNTSAAFDQAILRVKSAYTNAQNSTTAGKQKQQKQLSDNYTNRYLKVDSITENKQNEVKKEGLSYKNALIEYSVQRNKDADTENNNNKLEIALNAAYTRKKYSQHREYDDVEEAVTDSEKEHYKTLNTSTADLKKTLLNDALESSEDFVKEAGETAEKLPETKSSAQNNIKSIFEEAKKQFAGVSNKPLADLQKRINATVVALQQAKQTTLASIEQQKKEAYVQIDAETVKG
ncbi:MAG: hypothetical protein ACRC3B_00170, partial [Bacteroidia bacterium]